MEDRAGNRGIVLVELVRLVVVAFFTAAGYRVAQGIVSSSDSGRILLGAVVGSLCGYVTGGALGRAVATLLGAAEQRIAKMPGADLVAGGIGSVGGLLIAAGIGWPLLFVPQRDVALAVLGFVTIVMGFLGFRAGVQKREDLLQLFGLSFRTRASDLRVLDTSAILDPRLLDCVRSGIVRGTLLIAPFVLEEVQAIADAGDPVRRARGRRGLEMLAAMRRERLADIRPVERLYPEFGEVDAKVVALARDRGASIVTNDIALARIAELQGLEVLSLNALAEVLRVPITPGEGFSVLVTKEGREANQGVGYLDDGSMVVVDGGRAMIGTSAEVVATSVVQTSGGRMVFAKPAGRDPAPAGHGSESGT
ncbi:MAG: PIN/TRAM domain-containing protein, partial [Actinomycetota bacterium]